ncbi:MAG: hypothetical protein QM805_16870 [Pseudomonas sp.]
MNLQTDQREQLARRRRGAVRTARIVAAIAVGVYAAFILSGVLRG